MLVKSIFTATCLVVVSSAAFAAAPVAMLSNVAGTVLVDQGSGFVQVKADAPLISGSRVLLSRDGKGTLIYAGINGCKLPLSANTITTVGSTKDCRPSSQVAGQAPPPPPAPGVVIVSGLGMAGLAAVAETVAALEKKPEPQPPASF